MSVERLKFWCQHVLPLVYDDSLSYYEAICKVVDKLNETITYVNTFTDNFHEYVDSSVNAIDVKLTNQMNALQNKIDSQIADFQKEINAKLDEMNVILEESKAYVDESVRQNMMWVQKQISVLKMDVANDLDTLRKYSDYQDGLLYSYIDTEIKKVIGMIPEITTTIVVNPITGKQEKIQETINYLTYVFKYFAWDCRNYDSSDITADSFDNSKITAYKFDVYGYKLLGTDYRFIMRSPVSGVYTNYKNVIMWLIDLQRPNVLTAQGLDDLEYTATSLDNLNANAFQRDFNNITEPIVNNNMSFDYMYPKKEHFIVPYEQGLY